MKINAETVDKIANLARLEVSDTEKAGMIEDMNRILNFMSKLNEVDTTGVEPLIYLTEEMNTIREDEVKQVITHKEALINAPKHDNDFFLVSKVITIK